MKLLKKLYQDESGATAIEYGLIAALISVAIIATVASIGDQLATAFTTIDSELANAGGAT